MADAKINPSMPNSGNRYIDVMVGILTLSLYWFITAKLHPSWVHNTKKEDSQGTVTILWKNAEESEPKYAEANPDLPSNTPDQTDYFSTKDQQAAQPIDSKDLTLQTSQLPQLDGTSQNLKVVSAPLPLPTVPNNEQAQPASKIKQPAHTNQNNAGMAPQELNDQIEDKENEGLSYDAKERTYPNEKKIINLSQKQYDDSGNDENSISPTMDNYKRARPVLSPTITSGPILSNSQRAPRVGKVGIECKLNPFGVYVQKMLSAIEQQWYQLIIGSRSYIQYDQFPRKVIFRFSLQSSGKIEALEQIDKGPINLGVELCRQAIASRSPFGQWDEEMVNSFGHADEVIINFEYKQ